MKTFKLLSFASLILCSLHTTADVLSRTSTEYSKSFICYSSPDTQDKFRILVISTENPIDYEIYAVRGDNDVSQPLLSTSNSNNDFLSFSGELISLKISALNKSRYPHLHPNGHEAIVDFAQFSNGLELKNSPIECEVLMSAEQAP